MPSFSITTDRLILHPIVPEDFDFIFANQSDPEMMQHIRAAESDPEVIRQRMQTWLQYMTENPGLGIWTGRLKTSGQPVATGVLRHLEYTPGQDLELGYLVAKDLWGQGLATEITQGLIKYAFAHFPNDRILAVTSPEHRASQRVLEKCGFRLKGRRVIYEGECTLFELLRP